MYRRCDSRRVGVGVIGFRRMRHWTGKEVSQHVERMCRKFVDRAGGRLPVLLAGAAISRREMQRGAPNQAEPQKGVNRGLPLRLHC